MKQLVAVLVGIVGMVIGPGGLLAQDEVGADPVEVVSQTPAGPAASQVVEEAQRLRQLKQQDPEAFRQAVQEKKAALRERMANLKETNPEAFKRMKHQLLQQQRRKLAHLKEQNPEKFQEVMERRRAHLEQKLEDVKTNNPERYAEIMEHREAAKQRWQNATPEQRQEWLQRHPGVDRDTNPPGSRGGPGTNWENPEGSPGVRDHGQGEGRDGVGMGGERRHPGAGPSGGPRGGGGRPQDGGGPRR